MKTGTFLEDSNSNTEINHESLIIQIMCMCSSNGSRKWKATKTLKIWMKLFKYSAQTTTPAHWFTQNFISHSADVCLSCVGMYIILFYCCSCSCLLLISWYWCLQVIWCHRWTVHSDIHLPSIFGLHCHQLRNQRKRKDQSFDWKRRWAASMLSISLRYQNEASGCWLGFSALLIVKFTKTL